MQDTNLSATTSSPAGTSGAFLLLTFVSFAGIVASCVYSGYVAIALGAIVVALALATKAPESKRERTIVFSLAAASVLLGVGAIALGVVSRALAEIVQAG